MEAAVVAAGICYFEPDLGVGSSNDAEWLAAIHALTVASRLGVADVQLRGDSAFVVDQANGGSSRGPAMAAYHQAFEALRANFASVRIRRIGRAQNLAGIFLGKRRSGR